jgi:hypothetical protein
VKTPVDVLKVRPAGNPDAAHFSGNSPPIAVTANGEIVTPVISRCAPGLVSLGGRAMIQSNSVLSAALPSWLVAVMTTGRYVPATVGVPVISPPLEDSVRPAGRLLDVQVRGSCPPVTSTWRFTARSV